MSTILNLCKLYWFMNWILVWRQMILIIGNINPKLITIIASKISLFIIRSIAILKIENSDDLNKGLCDYILNLKREDNPQKSMVGGYHTKEDILKDDNKFVQEFRNIIQ